MAVIADEVYQVNVYNSSMKFDSFKKTIRDMGDDYNDVPLFSLQSISKGYYGKQACAFWSVKTSAFVGLSLAALHVLPERESWDVRSLQPQGQVQTARRQVGHVQGGFHVKSSCDEKPVCRAAA